MSCRVRRTPSRARRGLARLVRRGVVQRGVVQRGVVQRGVVRRGVVRRGVAQRILSDLRHCEVQDHSRSSGCAASTWAVSAYVSV
ncbi:hypothetical protein ACQP2E_04625 [Actinoplanes sp. CA-015351]|uniref:hypothetical protein n=1 Tax=Actinoplanes sp. CA-015351 TaxID=3239897 RepID=UPI003D978BB1